jgi:hypothetical protein
MYNGGANLGAMLSAKRDDLIFLGSNFAKVRLTNKIDMNLVHPKDGSAYGISLKAQQRIDKAVGMQRCKVMVLGHYHKTDFLNYRGTYAITNPSFFGQSEFLEGKNIRSDIGGTILTFKTDNKGELLSLSAEFILFDEIKDDWKNYR